MQYSGLISSFHLCLIPSGFRGTTKESKKRAVELSLLFVRSLHLLVQRGLAVEQDDVPIHQVAVDDVAQVQLDRVQLVELLQRVQLLEDVRGGADLVDRLGAGVAADSKRTSGNQPHTEK